jgi:hypothetical protein
MAEFKVKFNKDVLTVDSSDLIRKARTPAAKPLLVISPFCIFTEINLSGVKVDAALESKLVKAAEAKAAVIQKELLKQLKQLVDDLTVLSKQDQQGNEKAGESAEKRVKTVNDNIEEQLVDFGHDIREALKKLVKIPTGVKTVSRGHFRGLKLLYAFKGGQKAAFTEAYEATAKNFDTFADGVLSSSRDEEKQRGGALRALQDSAKGFHNHEETEAGKTKDAQRNLDDAREKANDKPGDSKTTKELQKAEETWEKLPKEREANWAKYVIQEARSLQSQMQGWSDQLLQYQKQLTAADKEALISLGKIKKNADNKEKKAVQKVIDELHKLNRMVTNRLATVNELTSAYKRCGSAAPKREAWAKRLDGDIKTVRAMKDINAQELNKAAREMVRIAKNM